MKIQRPEDDGAKVCECVSGIRSLLDGFAFGGASSRPVRVVCHPSNQGRRLQRFQSNGNHELPDRRLRPASYEFSGHQGSRQLDYRQDERVAACQRPSRALGTVRPRLVQRTLFRPGDIPAPVSADCLSEGLDTGDEWSGNRSCRPRANPERGRHRQVPGQLKGKFVLTAAFPENPERFEPQAHRYTDSELAELATQPVPVANAEDRAAQFRAQRELSLKIQKFLVDEGVAAWIEPSRSDDGTVF